MKTLKMQDKDLSVSDQKMIWIEKANCLRQRLENKIRLDQGSWFLGPLSGLPWFDIYKAKSISSRMVYANIEKVLKSDPDVSKIISIDVTFDRGKGKLSAGFSVQSIYGDIEGSL